MWWIIPAVTSLMGAYQQYESANMMKELAGRQESMARENAALVRRENAENERRQNLKDQRALSTARARAAASGVSVTDGFTGSAGNFLSFMETEQDDELEWMKRTGESRARMTLEEGYSQAASTRIGASNQRAGMFSSIAQSTMFLGQSGLFSGTGTADATYRQNNWSSQYNSYWWS